MSIVRDNPIARLLNEAQEERAQWPEWLKRTRHVNDDGSVMTDTQKHEAERLARAQTIIENMSPEERRRLRGWLDQHSAPSGELYHKKYCDEYHQHTAPRCCASDCWCRVPGVVGQGSGLDTRYKQVPEGAIEARSDDVASAPTHPRVLDVGRFYTDG